MKCMKRAFGEWNDHECKILFIIRLFNWDFIAFKMNIISMRKRIVDTGVVNDVTYTVRAKMLLHVWSYDFYDMTLSTEKQWRHLIKAAIFLFFLREYGPDVFKWHQLQLHVQTSGHVFWQWCSSHSRGQQGNRHQWIRSSWCHVRQSRPLYKYRTAGNHVAA